jgi:AAHS family benzoate transporter-like MFS transporter
MIAAIFSGFQAGGVCGSLLSLTLFPIWGWRSVYLIGLAPLLFVPLVMKYYPDSPYFYFERKRTADLRRVLKEVRPELALADDATFTASHTGKASAAALFQEHRGPSTVAFWAVTFMNFYIAFGLGIWLPKLMMNAGYALNSSLLFSSTYYIGAFIGILVGGRCADRVGAKPVMFTSYATAFLMITLLAFRPGTALIVLLVFVAGGCMSASQGVTMAYAALFYPPAIRATGQGFIFGIGRFGAVFGPAIAGFIISLKLSLVVSFLGVSVAALLALIAVACIQDRYGFVVLAGVRGAARKAAAR